MARWRIQLDTSRDTELVAVTAVEKHGVGDTHGSSEPGRGLRSDQEGGGLGA